MDAGRELDALIAERIFGDRDAEGLLVYQPKIAEKHIPHYSTDIGAAWQVVERLHQLDIGIELWSLPGEDVECWTLHRTSSGSHESYWQNFAPTVPHVICLASLRALGVKVKAAPVTGGE